MAVSEKNILKKRGFLSLQIMKDLKAQILNIEFDYYLKIKDLLNIFFYFIKNNQFIKKALKYKNKYINRLRWIK